MTSGNPSLRTRDLRAAVRRIPRSGAGARKAFLTNLNAENSKKCRGRKVSEKLGVFSFVPYAEKSSIHGTSLVLILRISLLGWTNDLKC